MPNVIKELQLLNRADKLPKHLQELLYEDMLDAFENRLKVFEKCPN